MRPLARRDRPELMDESGLDQRELAENLRDIRRVNRFFGGTATTMRHLRPLLDRVPADREAVILDLATGSADIPLAAARWAERCGRSVRIVASDISDQMLDAARNHLAGHPGIALERYDARAVTLPDGGVDIVLCSLALHHLPPADALRVLTEMDRLARVGFVLNDLARSRLGFVAAWVAAHVTTRNRLTRHDAPLSVLRAYTPNELGDLFAQARINGVTIARHPWFRMAAVKCVAEG